MSECGGGTGFHATGLIKYLLFRWIWWWNFVKFWNLKYFKPRSDKMPKNDKTTHYKRIINLNRFSCIERKIVLELTLKYRIYVKKKKNVKYIFVAVLASVPDDNNFWNRNARLNSYHTPDLCFFSSNFFLYTYFYYRFVIQYKFDILLRPVSITRARVFLLNNRKKKPGTHCVILQVSTFFRGSRRLGACNWKIDFFNAYAGYFS